MSTSETLGQAQKRRDECRVAARFILRELTTCCRWRGNIGRWAPPPPPPNGCSFESSQFWDMSHILTSIIWLRGLMVPVGVFQRLPSRFHTWYHGLTGSIFMESTVSKSCLPNCAHLPKPLVVWPQIRKTKANFSLCPCWCRSKLCLLCLKSCSCLTVFNCACVGYSF